MDFYCLFLFVLSSIVMCTKSPGERADSTSDIGVSDGEVTPDPFNENGNTLKLQNISDIQQNVSKTETSSNEQKSRNVHLKNIYDTLEFIQDVYVIPIVCTIGIVGNSVVASFLYERRGSNSSFIYMFAVLVADTLSLVSDLFLPCATLLRRNNVLSVRKMAAQMYFWNKIFINYVLRGTAFNILCVLSAERLMAVKYPLSLNASLTVRKPHYFVFFSFIVSVATKTPAVLFSEMREVFDNSSNGTIFQRLYTTFYLTDKPKNDLVIIIIHFFAGPVQIVFFCAMNILIVHGIYQNKKRLLKIKMKNSGRMKTIANLQVKLCKIFLALCFSNILAFIPNSVATMSAKLFPELGWSLRDYSAKLFLHGGNFLRILNSASDFIIMMTMSVEIRQDFKNKILRKAKSRKDSPKTQKYQANNNCSSLSTI